MRGRTGVRTSDLIKPSVVLYRACFTIFLFDEKRTQAYGDLEFAAI